jgi:hypothetical protein
MLQRYEKHVCVTQSHPFLYANSLILNLRYVMAQKSDEVRKWSEKGTKKDGCPIKAAIPGMIYAIRLNRNYLTITFATLLSVRTM